MTCCIELRTTTGSLLGIFLFLPLPLDEGFLTTICSSSGSATAFGLPREYTLACFRLGEGASV